MNIPRLHLVSLSGVVERLKLTVGFCILLQMSRVCTVISLTLTVILDGILTVKLELLLMRILMNAFEMCL